MKKLVCICLILFLAGCRREKPDQPPAQAPAAHGGFDEEAVKRLIRLDRIEADNHRALQP
jgi:hypothetical protein